MDYVFISHAEEDSDAALEIARLLESQGYATWTYELDSLPGRSYLLQTGDAIEACRVFLLVVSRAALPSNQLLREVVRAHEAGKKFLPVLRDISDAKFKAEQREWKEAIGAATSVAYTAEDLERLGGRLVSGLRLLGVTPRDRPDDARLDAIRRELLLGKSPTGPKDQDSGKLPPQPPVQHKPVDVPPVPPPRPPMRIPLYALAACLLLAGILWRSGVLSGLATEVVIGVMDIKPYGLSKEKEGMAEFTRDGLNSVLNDLGKVPVFSKQKIDFIRTKRSLSEIEAAEELGITRMISGTLSSSTASKLVLQLQVIDITNNGMLIGTTQVRGTEEELLAMQNEAAFEVMRRLKVDVDDTERARIISSRTNDLQGYYQMLAGTMDDFGAADAAPSEKPRAPDARNLLGPSVAYAADADKDAVLAVLERYRRALEAGNVDLIAAEYVAFGDSTRQALTRYFSNVQQLKVEFSDFDILVEGDEALATFKRIDAFKDAHTGREVQLSVQVNSVVAKQGDGWKIKALGKPS